jgi:hypothetical protein
MVSRSANHVLSDGLSQDWNTVHAAAKRNMRINPRITISISPNQFKYIDRNIVSFFLTVFFQSFKSGDQVRNVQRSGVQKLSQEGTIPVDDK